MWLKEYEPGKDPNELLYHSRTFSVEASPVKVYVPWISDDGAIYGGDENPLLRSGLALATYSLEYLVTNNQSSLEHAISIFDYIEASEWVDCSGKPTGFFLRSRWPQDDDVDRTPPWYASIDEIAGMTLGLYYFHDALTRNGPEDLENRVVALVERLGDHMKANHFFLVPPIDPYCQLPLERHNGWSGGYLLQWFLNGGFKAITGRSFQSGEVDLDSGFWARMKALDWHGPGSDDIDDLAELIKLDLNSRKRAVLSIKGLGAQMYWGGSGRKYPLEVTVYSILPPFKVDLTFMIDMDEWSQYNFPMLLHVFQLGLADRDPEDVAVVKREMGRLIAGVLGTETQRTHIDLHSLVNSYLGFPIDLAILLGAGTWVDTDESESIEVGTENAVADYYAAAIAQKYDLFSKDTFPYPYVSGFMSESVVDEYEANLMTLLNASIQQAKGDLAIFSPIGQPDHLLEPHHNVLSSENENGTIIPDHNPEKKLGSAFAWEFAPGLDDNGLPNRMQGGKAEGNLGVTDGMVVTIYDMGLDLVKEGAGLDYMLPTMLLAQSMGAPVDITNGINVPEVFSPDVLLDACTSFPFYGSWAEPNPWFEPCSDPWPRREIDLYDFFNEEYLRNDRIGVYGGGPTEISCGTVTDLTIDHSTLYSRGPGFRTPPIPAKYYTHATKGEPYPNSGVIGIWNTDDIDYYAGNCDPNRDLYVEVYVQAESPTYQRLVVDGKETTSSIIVDDGRKKLQISVPPKPSHLIMFTGDAVDYELHISSTPFESTIPSESPTETGPLGPPTGLAVAPFADGTVHITWDVQEGAQAYGLRYRKGDTTSFVVISNDVTPPYNHSGLENGGKYSYSVRSFEPIHEWSAYSEEVSTMAAGTVEGECPGLGWYDTNTCIRATPGDGSILVEWNQLVDEYISWEHWVYWQEEGSGTNWNIKKELYWSSGHLITELQNGVPYTVMVKAWYCQRDEPHCMGGTGEIPESFSISDSDKVTVMPFEGLGAPSSSP